MDKWLKAVDHSNIACPNKHDTLANAALMSVHRLRRWPSIKTALGKRLVFAVLVDLANDT